MLFPVKDEYNLVSSFESSEAEECRKRWRTGSKGVREKERWENREGVRSGGESRDRPGKATGKMFSLTLTAQLIFSINQTTQLYTQ